MPTDQRTINRWFNTDAFAIPDNFIWGNSGVNILETGEPDPPLNADGQRRAEALAKLLADAGVYYFYTNETNVEQATSIDELVARVRKTADPARPTLIVGHRGTVPQIVKALGGGDIPELRADEHDRLIVLTMLPGGKASIVTLRYGQ